MSIGNSSPSSSDQAVKFDHAILSRTVDSIDSTKDQKVTLEELRTASKYQVEIFMDHLRAAAEELRDANGKIDPAKAAALKETLRRFQELNSMKGKQEAEVHELIGGTLRGFYDLYREIDQKLVGLHAETERDVVLDPKNLSFDTATDFFSDLPSEDGKHTGRLESLNKTVYSGVLSRIFKMGKKVQSQSYGELQLAYEMKKASGDMKGLEALLSRVCGEPISLSGEVSTERLEQIRTLFQERLAYQVAAFGGLNAVLQGKEAEYVESLAETRKSIAEGLKQAQLDQRLDEIASALPGVAVDKKAVHAALVEEIMQWNYSIGHGTVGSKGINYDGIVRGITLRHNDGILGFSVSREVFKSRKNHASVSIGAGIGFSGGKIDVLPYVAGQKTFILADKNSLPKISPIEGNVTFTPVVSVSPISVSAGIDLKWSDRLNAIAEQTNKFEALLESLYSLENGKVVLNEKKLADAVKDEKWDDRENVVRNLKALSAFANKSLARLSEADKKTYFSEMKKSYSEAYQHALVSRNEGFSFSGISLGIIFGKGFVFPFIGPNFEHAYAYASEGKVTGQNLAELKANQRFVKSIPGVREVPGKNAYFVPKIYRLPKESSLADLSENPETDGFIVAAKPGKTIGLREISSSYQDGLVVRSLEITDRTPSAPKAVPKTEAPVRADMSEYVDAEISAKISDAMKNVTSVHIRSCGADMRYRKGRRDTGFPAFLSTIRDAMELGSPEGAKSEKKNSVLGDVRGYLENVAVEGKPVFRHLLSYWDSIANEPRKRFILLKTIMELSAGSNRMRIAKNETPLASLKEEFASDAHKRAFDRNLQVHTGVSALGRVQDARNAYDAAVVSGAETKRGDVKEFSGYVGFVNMTQIVQYQDEEGKTKTRSTFRGLVAMAGTMKLYNGEPAKVDDPAVRDALIEKIPSYVIESFRQHFNKVLPPERQFKDGDHDSIRRILKGENMSGVKMGMDLFFARFALCGNDTYLLKPIEGTCTIDGVPCPEPVLPEYSTSSTAIIGKLETEMSSMRVVDGRSKRTDGGNADTPPNPFGSTNPGVTGAAAPSNVAPPGWAGNSGGAANIE